MPGFSQPGRDGEAPPPVRLGTLAEGGLAPAIMAIVERGVTRRPGQARRLDMEVELRMQERYPPVRILFEPWCWWRTARRRRRPSRSTAPCRTWRHCS